MVITKTRLSGRLSESISYLCLLLGVVMPLALRNIWGIGGSLLCVSFGVVFLLRKNAGWKACRLGLTDVQSGESGARKLIWNGVLECGIRAIDVQHRHLFEVGNALLDSVYRNPSDPDATSKAQNLINAVKSHFKSEESLLASWNHPLSEDHKSVHKNLLARANELLVRSENGTLSYQCVLNFLVDDLVYGHIASEDQKFLFPV